MPERAFGSGLQETAIFARPIFLPKFQRPHVLLRLSHGPRPHFSNIFLVLVPSELEKNPHPSQKRIWIVLTRSVPRTPNLDDRTFQLDSRLFSSIFCPVSLPPKITFFSFPKRTKRSHYLKKGQARSSMKISNKAKIILIIINGNVDFTI